MWRWNKRENRLFLVFFHDYEVKTVNFDIIVSVVRL